MTLYHLKLSTLITAVLLFNACKSTIKNVETKPLESEAFPDEIILNAPGQNPEGITFNTTKNVFYLSAINPNPSIVTVDFDGNVTTFSNDKNENSRASFGLKTDIKNNRMLACINGPKIGNIHIYNLN